MLWSFVNWINLQSVFVLFYKLYCFVILWSYWIRNSVLLMTIWKYNWMLLTDFSHAFFFAEFFFSMWFICQILNFLHRIWGVFSAHCSNITSCRCSCTFDMLCIYYYLFCFSSNCMCNIKNVLSLFLYVNTKISI